ncbi:PREDICTED: uncharacterized protein LOC102021088 isoform X2 [Chinchilla lanigera]|uniref:uncharacterized protein LOC102021088 isoform X2 n=1 Tax=Chinchilla lanigera TaxID=34839 RepID=UPI000696249D|nr:PREDICTED: uncharacterized protein LOC102021088 isoform X2 [Chinchilla lanigera]
MWMLRESRTDVVRPRVDLGNGCAQALECHVCAYNGDNCFNPMRCPAMVRYCMTTRTYYTPYRMKGQQEPFNMIGHPGLQLVEKQPGALKMAFLMFCGTMEWHIFSMRCDRARKKKLALRC